MLLQFKCLIMTSHYEENILVGRRNMKFVTVYEFRHWGNP